MITFNGNSMLIVEQDKAYAVQLMEILRERGANVERAYNVSDARKHLHKSDYDMVICSHSFTDGYARDLVQWCRDNLSPCPVFAAIGNCSPIEKKQLQRLHVENFFSKTDSAKLFQDISQALFGAGDFRRTLLASPSEKTMQYELCAEGKKLPVRALEIMEKGVFLSFDEAFPVGLSARLLINCAEGLKIESCFVEGELQGKFSGGQFFKVSENDSGSWLKLISQLNQKQAQVSEFLKKASGR